MVAARLGGRGGRGGKARVLFYPPSCSGEMTQGMGIFGEK
jgi:hypothetical protein